MSDQAGGLRKPPKDEIDELPSEAVPPGMEMDGLSLEEQFARMTNLDIEDEEKDRKED